MNVRCVLLGANRSILSFHFFLCPPPSSSLLLPLGSNEGEKRNSPIKVFSMLITFCHLNKFLLSTKITSDSYVKLFSPPKTEAYEACRSGTDSRFQLISHRAEAQLDFAAHAIKKHPWRFREMFLKHRRPSLLHSRYSLENAMMIFYDPAPLYCSSCLP